MTFTDLLSKYSRYRILRPATTLSYQQAIRKLSGSYQEAIRNLSRFFASISSPLPLVQELSVDHLLAHRAWCLKTMAATSYNKHRRHIRALLNFCLAEGALSAGPMHKVGPAPAGARKPKVVPNTWYKRTKVMLADTDSPLRPQEFWRVLISVVHFTGLRRRQIVELQWDDVLWGRSALRLRSEGSKSLREWIVPIPKWLTHELREFKQLIQLRCNRALADTDQVLCLPVFAQKIRSPRMTEEHVSRAFEALSRALGFRISAHRVRHTSATAMLGATGHLKGVSDMLGHTNIKLTASTYVHPQLGHLRKVQAALSGYKREE